MCVCVCVCACVLPAPSVGEVEFYCSLFLVCACQINARLILYLICSSILSLPPQASEQGRPPEHTSKFYAKGALQYLVPILTQTLTKQVWQPSSQW